MVPDSGNALPVDGEKIKVVPDRLLYPVEDVAILLGCSGRNVWRLIDEGRIQVTHLDGRRLVGREELDRFIASLRVEKRVPADPKRVAA
jgi:excisionase family DNA binding protein